MAESTRDIQSILAALSSSQSPLPAPPGQVVPTYAPLLTHTQQRQQVQPVQLQLQQQQHLPYTVPASSVYSAYDMPEPAQSGNLDLSSIRPVGSGHVSITDAIAKAKAFATERGITPYQRPVVEGGRVKEARQSRSRSPPRQDKSYNEDHGRRDFRVRSYTPPARDRVRGGADGPGRGRSPTPKTVADDGSETIQIESNLVGLIIGRQGENLRRIEAETTCRVQFLPTSEGGPVRQCRISGTKAGRDQVKDAINRIVEENGMALLNNRPVDKSRDLARASTAPLREGEDHMKIMVPDRTVGLIIGRGGETIRDLQERSGCHINIVDESKSINGLRPVNLIGAPEAATLAKELIMEIIDSDNRAAGDPNGKTAATGRSAYQTGGAGTTMGHAGPDKVNETMFVPSDAVGMIIGKGGETIREMQTSTGCKINVAQATGAGEAQREIGLVGTRESVMRAKMALEEKVAASRQKGTGGGGGRVRFENMDSGRNSQPQHQPYGHTAFAAPAAQPNPAAVNQQDPYASYGGYERFCSMWYRVLAAQQQQAALRGPNDGVPPAGSS